MPMTDALNSRLKDKSLLRAGCYIGGRWLETAENGTTFDVTNPANGELLAVLPNCGEAEARRAIEAAEIAQGDWAKKTGKERAAVLRWLHDLMIANADDLAAILTAEQGKPLAEARGEILCRLLRRMVCRRSQACLWRHDTRASRPTSGSPSSASR